jgi:hypothetical protein
MYDVVVLIEEELTEADALQVVELHREALDDLSYHLVLPCDNLAASFEAGLANLGLADLYAMGPADQQVELAAEAQQSGEDQAADSLGRSIQRLTAFGRQADGSITHERPVDALRELVKRVDGQVVVILTRPHAVAEFFHADWSAQARRHLGVPVVHLLQQDEGPRSATAS